MSYTSFETPHVSLFFFFDTTTAITIIKIITTTIIDIKIISFFLSFNIFLKKSIKQFEPDSDFDDLDDFVVLRFSIFYYKLFVNLLFKFCFN